MEVGKHHKYDDHARAKNAVLVPIAFNEYGLFGKEAEDLFVLLANEATPAMTTQFRTSICPSTSSVLNSTAN